MKKLLGNTLLCVFILLMMSCTTIGDREDETFRMAPAHEGIHKEFKPYIEEFILESNGTIKRSDLNKITMGLQEYNSVSPPAGTCWVTPVFKEIDINKKWWRNNKSQLRRKELLFHELGHCILNRNHTMPTSADGFHGWIERFAFKIGILKRIDGWLEDGCPSSYMHPSMIRLDCLKKHDDYYIKELFNLKDNVTQ